jgi:hypothetical protein
MREHAQLDELLAYNKGRMAILSAHDRTTLPPGFGPANLSGGEFDNDRKMEDLKLLYRTYLGDALETGELTSAKSDALQQLKTVFGMGTRETESVTEETTARVYRKLLSDKVKSGELEAAPSKADFLQDLCDKLQFDPVVASRVHEDIYRQKIENVSATGSVSEEDSSALLRLRVLLCIPKKVVRDASLDILGKVFRVTVDDALSATAGGFTSDDAKQVAAKQAALRLEPDIAKEVLSNAVRAKFMNYIKEARSVGRGKPIEAAKKLKELVFFSNMVVVPLLDELKPKEEAPAVVEAEVVGEEAPTEEEKEAAAKAAAEKVESEKSMTEDEKVKSLQKTQDAFAKELEKSQREINLRMDLSESDRADIYRQFLIYCLSGNTVQLAFGATVTVERDQMEFMRLAQLGDILGLSPFEIQKIHASLAEQAFERNVEQILADGRMTPEKEKMVQQIQEQLGVPDELRTKVVGGILGRRMKSTVADSLRDGKTSIADIEELRARGVDVTTAIGANQRQSLYKKSVEKALSDGSGVFDVVRLNFLHLTLRPGSIMRGTSLMIVSGADVG